jgi:hypothetical protein
MGPGHREERISQSDLLDLALEISTTWCPQGLRQENHGQFKIKSHVLKRTQQPESQSPG